MTSVHCIPEAMRLDPDDGRAIFFGSLNPAAINQMNPGHRVSGMRKPAFGTTMLSQLNSPVNAIGRPNPTTHFGRSFMKPAVIDTPAIKRPNGMVKPGPPRATAR
jgi:hypothetical protein